MGIVKRFAFISEENLRKEIDMNYFNGTESDFTARYGFGETPTPKGTLMARYSDKLVEYKIK